MANKVADREQRELTATAHHEAGHAIAALHERIPFQFVTVVPTSGTLGRVELFCPPTLVSDVKAGNVPRKRLESEILVSLCGPEAERRFIGEHNHQGANSDLRWSVDLLAMHAGSDDEVRAWIALMQIRAAGFVEGYWEEIASLADALIERKTMKRTHVRKLLASRGVGVVVSKGGR